MVLIRGRDAKGSTRCKKTGFTDSRLNCFAILLLSEVFAHVTNNCIEVAVRQFRVQALSTRNESHAIFNGNENNDSILKRLVTNTPTIMKSSGVILSAIVNSRKHANFHLLHDSDTVSGYLGVNPVHQAFDDILILLTEEVIHITNHGVFYSISSTQLRMQHWIRNVIDTNLPTAEEIESNKQKKYAAQCTLYTCLETFLRALHPLMPFVTEELWQRLPNRTALTSVPSIMIASYPQEVPGWDNDAAVQGLEVIKSCVHAGRSLRTDYKIGNHVKANFYYRTENAQVLAQVQAQQEDFCTLAKGAIFQHLDAATPNPNKSMSIKVVSESLSLLLDLTGLIDIDAELVRLKKDQERIMPYIDQYKRKMSAEGYPGKVPESVQKTNTDKLMAYEAELATTLKAMEEFELMKL